MLNFVCCPWLLPSNLVCLFVIKSACTTFPHANPQPRPLFIRPSTSYFLLSFIFIALGAVISQIAWFRTTAASYSMFFVQIMSFWLGNVLARVLPAKEINLYFFTFNLNPGPFSIKEHVLITLAYVGLHNLHDECHSSF